MLELIVVSSNQCIGNMSAGILLRFESEMIVHYSGAQLNETEYSDDHADSVRPHCGGPTQVKEDTSCSRKIPRSRDQTRVNQEDSFWCVSDSIS